MSLLSCQTIEKLRSSYNISYLHCFKFTITAFVAHLEDKVEPVGPLRAHPGWEVAGDPGGGGVLRVLQQEVRADRGLAHHRDELVGEPDLNKIT